MCWSRRSRWGVRVPRSKRWAVGLSVAEVRVVIRTIKELLGHSAVKTTMIYTHVLYRGGAPVASSADIL